MECQTSDHLMLLQPASETQSSTNNPNLGESGATQVPHIPQGGAQTTRAAKAPNTFSFTETSNQAPIDTDNSD